MGLSDLSGLVNVLDLLDLSGWSDLSRMSNSSACSDLLDLSSFSGLVCSGLSLSWRIMDECSLAHFPLLSFALFYFLSFSFSIFSSSSMHLFFFWHTSSNHLWARAPRTVSRFAGATIRSLEIRSLAEKK